MYVKDHIYIFMHLADKIFMQVKNELYMFLYVKIEVISSYLPK